MGYSTARNSVGWSNFTYSRGRIIGCKIYLNPKWMRRYNPAKTMAHEIMHCTGFDSHTAGNTLMHKFGKGPMTQDLKDWAKLLYSLPVGSRI